MATAAEQTLRNGAAIISANFQVSVRTALINGALAAGGRANAFVQSMGSALSEDAINRATLLRANDELAARARVDTISAYAQRQPRRQIAPYRVGAGRIGYGLIESALADEGHAGASSAFRVVPFDVELLDAITRVGARGALWRQINFGAEPNSGKKPQAFQVRMDRGGGFVLQMPDLAIPAGVLKRPSRSFFVGGDGRYAAPNPEGDDQFVAGRPAPPIPLRGSRATQFMDAAAASLARNVGPTYAGVYAKLLGDAQQVARLKARGVTVPKRPATVGAPRFFVIDVKG